MHIINYQIQQGADQPIRRERLRNRYTVLGRTNIFPMLTLDCDETLLPKPAAEQGRPTDKLPHQIIKELEGVLRKRRQVQQLSSSKSINQKSRAGDESVGLSLQGEKTIIWSQPRQPVKKQRPEQPKPVEINQQNKHLSLELYSRMISSFKQSYDLGTSTFNKAAEHKKVRYSLHTFRQSVLQKDLSSELISRRGLSLLRQKSKRTSIKQLRESVALPAEIEKKQPMITLQPIDQKPSLTNANSHLVSKYQTRQPEQRQTHIRVTKQHDRPWRTNFRFPELIVSSISATKRDFTPWRKVEQTEQDLPLT